MYVCVRCCACAAAVDPVVPYTRVNHATLMITDNTLYVGTSNWVGDYFKTTCGTVLRHQVCRPSVRLFKVQALVHACPALPARF